ncbi:MAG: tetratricopeptide repeat protein [Pseudomonadota bacterium]
MTCTRLFSYLGCALLLSACATDGARPAAKIAGTTFDHRMAEAELAGKTGQYEQSVRLLHAVAVSYPAEKAPWVQLAQMRFDRSNYGEAISDALEALRRDPDDKAANNIVAVSGVRLGAKSLGELNRYNHVGGVLRAEALDLARQLRASVVDDGQYGIRRVAPQLKKNGAGLSAPRLPSSSLGTVGSSAVTSGGPFEVLK